MENKMRLVQPAIPAHTDTTLHGLRVLRRTEVEQLVGLKRSQLYLLMAQGSFPKPVRLSERAVGWRAQDVAKWLSSREAA